jgi:hypothetical protein
LPTDTEGNEISQDEYDRRLAAREARWASKAEASTSKTAEKVDRYKDDDIYLHRNKGGDLTGISSEHGYQKITPKPKNIIDRTADKLRGVRAGLQDYQNKSYENRMERRGKQIKELRQKNDIARLKSQTATYERKANPPAYKPKLGINTGGIDLGSGFGGFGGFGGGNSGISLGGRGGGIDLGPMFGGGPKLEPKKKHKKQNKKSKNSGQNIHIHIDRR